MMMLFHFHIDAFAIDYAAFSLMPCCRLLLPCRFRHCRYAIDSAIRRFRHFSPAFHAIIRAPFDVFIAITDSSLLIRFLASSPFSLFHYCCHADTLTRHFDAAIIFAISLMLLMLIFISFIFADSCSAEPFRCHYCRFATPFRCLLFAMRDAGFRYFTLIFLPPSAMLLRYAMPRCHCHADISLRFRHFSFSLAMISPLFSPRYYAFTPRHYLRSLLI